MNLKMKNNKGITLIALVITIIVLLILAGVSIATLTGNNGILTQAQNSKKTTTEAEAKERIQLEVIGSYGKDGKLDIDELKANLTKNVPGVIVGDEVKFPLKVTLDEKLYKIESSGEMKEVVVDRTALKVGDYINYEPDTEITRYSSTKLTKAITGHPNNTSDITQDDLDWRILKIYEDGSMDLIGSLTTQLIYFQDAEAYNNGVYVMDDICKTLYSRGNIEARSVDLEDFESNLTETGKKAKATYIKEQVKALTGSDITNVDTDNNTVTYVTEKSYYPNIYAKENGSGIDTSTVKTDGIKVSEILKDAEGNPIYDTNVEENAYKQASTNGLTVTYNYYNIEININNFGQAYKVLTSNSSDIHYWIASRFVGCNSTYGRFGLRGATDWLGGSRVYGSYDNLNAGACFLRPVVHLESEVQIEVCTGTNDAENPHKITQY